MERCPKCNGLLLKDTYQHGGSTVDYLRCFNCGFRLYNHNNYDKKRLCLRCGVEIPCLSKKRKYCYSCLMKNNNKIKIYICKNCNKEFKAKKSRTHLCPACREYNRNEEYIKKSHILLGNIIKRKEAV